jgi:hypothetical protein
VAQFKKWRRQGLSGAWPDRRILSESPYRR